MKLDRTPDGASRGALPTVPADLEGWLQQLRPALSAFLMRKLRDPADVEDALQETSLRAWRYATRAEIRAPVSLCFRVAENVAIDFARRDRVPAVGGDGEAEVQIAEELGPDRSAAAMQELELVKRVIGQLPPGCRHVFLLSRSQGLSNPEISARCGVSIKMVEKQISRALRALREQARMWAGEQP